jgi:hypothetical protein
MRQQSLAGRALQEGRVVIRQQESPDQTRLGFAQVTGWPTPVQRLDPVSCQQTPGGGGARSEHTYGGRSGRRCCTLLLYSLFDSFELGF